MAKRRPPADESRRPPRHKVDFHPEIEAALQALIRDNHSAATEEIRNALRFYLRHLGYLPPLGPNPARPT